MKKITPYMYLAGSLLVPMISFAHGEVDDGHVEAAAAADPEQRMIVLAVVVGVFALMGFFVWYSRSKNTPAVSTPEHKDTSTSV